MRLQVSISDSYCHLSTLHKQYDQTLKIKTTFLKVEAHRQGKNQVKHRKIFLGSLQICFQNFSTLFCTSGNTGVV